MPSASEPDSIPRRKVPCTAVVLIPPADRWEPIQAIRRVHDPRVGRWMPHVTLLYPFVPELALASAGGLLRPVCESCLPFTVMLAGFDSFAHGTRWATVWLRPEPAAPVVQLQARLLECFPWCDDTSRHPDGFTPHLSVGRWPVRDAAAAQEALQGCWTALSWPVDRVFLIARPEEDDAPFSVRFELLLGQVPQVGA